MTAFVDLTLLYLDTGGAGADSESGSAVGGDADDDFDNDDDADLRKRSYDWGTAGGNAYTGATSNASGGNIVNNADNDGIVENAGGSEWFLHLT